jgi:hypothetical protein
MKIILSIIILFTVLASSTLFFITTKINPELIKKTTIEAIEKNIPGATAKIGTINYSLGSSVTLNIENVLLSEKKNKNKLLELKVLAVKIPILAILTSGGTIDVFTDAPVIFVRKRGDQLNWTDAIGKKVSEVVKDDSSKSKIDVKSIELPSFINKSKINFKLNDLRLLIDLGKNQKSELNISTVQVKDLSLNKSTAFEVASSIKFQIEKNQFFTTNIQVIGEAKLGSIIEKGILDLSTKVSISKTKMDNLDIVIPNVKGKAKITGSLNDINVDLDVGVDQIISFQSKINIMESKVSAKKIVLELVPEEAIKIFGESVKSPLRKVSFAGVKLKVLGGATLDLTKSHFYPDLKISTIKSVEIDAAEGLTVFSTIDGVIQGESVSINVKNKTLNGVISANVSTSINPLNIPSDISKLKPIKVNINLSHLKVPRELLQNILWGESTNKQNEIAVEKKLEVTAKGEKVLLPKVTVKLSGDRILVGDQETSLKGKIVVFKDKISSKDILLKYGEGKLSTVFSTVIHNTSKITNEFKIILNQVDVSAFNALFPPFINDIKGKYNGIVKGNVNIGSKINYTVNANITGVNGEIKKLNLKKILKPLIDKYAKGKANSLKDFSNKFDSLKLSTLLTEKVAKLNSFEMIGYENSSRITAVGYISMIDKNSKVKGKLSSTSLTPILKKNTGLTEIPYLMRGEGYVLLPNISYTAERLASGAAKEAVKKETKKIKKKLKKEAEKKIKNLLKGFKL